MVEPTLGQALKATAARTPDGLVILDGDLRLTYAELDRSADRLARGLLAEGVGHGAHVGIWLPTGAEWVIAFCAAARIGAVVVPVNTRYRTEEVRHVLAHAKVDLLFTCAAMWQTETWAVLNQISPDLAQATSPELALAGLPALRRVVMTDAAPSPAAIGFQALMEAGADDRAGLELAQARVAESDTLIICFTSGSTGRPKGVMHSHRSLRHAARLAQIQGLKPGELSLGNWPLHHAGGLFLLLIPSLIAGAAIVPINHWSGHAALDLIARHGVTVMGGIPTHYLDMADDPQVAGMDLSSLRYAYMGGANVSRDTFDRICGALRLADLPSTYGLTENTVSATFNLPGDSADLCARNCAPMVGDCAVRIVDPQTLASMPTGQAGEIQFRGTTVMDGYYADPEATQATITADGWLRTGDMGVLDAAGYLQPTGRLKEMLKVGGSNVSPTEVEATINQYPGVRNSTVVGAPHPRLTEVAYAFVEPAAGAEVDEAALIAFCRARIADYKVPRYVRLVEALPRLATGKIDRAGLAARAAQTIAGAKVA